MSVMEGTWLIIDEFVGLISIECMSIGAFNKPIKVYFVGDLLWSRVFLYLNILSSEEFTWNEEILNFIS